MPERDAKNIMVVQVDIIRVYNLQVPLFLTRTSKMSSKIAKKQIVENLQTKNLVTDLRALIDEAKTRVARTVNRELIVLCWKIGERINTEVLFGDRADYGKEIVKELSKALTREYGKGFGRSNLFNMLKFQQYFSDYEIVQTLSGQLSWSHFVQLIGIEDKLKREFYAEISRIERWSVRTLKEKIANQLFERTAIARKPFAEIENNLTELKKSNHLGADLIFRDPYVLDFLNLDEAHNESELEQAILDELQKFLLELGSGFCFVDRQKRMTIDGEDYYLDLLLYQRDLGCLVAIELKMGKFKAADKGQMELYLRWLDKYEKRQNETSPIGLVLCTSKSQEHVELLQLDKSNIRVAEYLTKMPPKEVLENKLHQTLEMLARKGLDTKSNN